MGIKPLITYFTEKFNQEYHSLSLWYFVSFIFGIVFYFSLGFQISSIYLTFIFIPISIWIIFKNQNLLLRFFVFLAISFILGNVVGKYREYNLKSSKINSSIISKIEGTIESIKPTEKGVQVVFNQAKILKLQDNSLHKLRISVPFKYTQDINLNDTVEIFVKLSPIQGAVIPGGYNFGFYSHFTEIEATGYAMSKPVILSHDNEKKDDFVYKLRVLIYDRLCHRMGKINGNFAAAILLGETKGINRELMKNMRQAGISHILCVSGLHLSLVAMIFFISTRFLLNLSNFIAFNYNIKVIAAIISLVGSYGYLELSGKQIAATRAFIMTAIFIISIIIGRTPYPLRSIALAAAFILCLNPEYVFHPSFQLSFIAVLSLISGYQFYLKNKWLLGESKGIFSSVKFYLASNIYSSFLASTLTAPIVISQFYIFSTYSIPMNLVAVPIMSFFLMPLSIVSLILMPFGLDNFVLKVLSFFIDIITSSAAYANDLPNAVWYFGYITQTALITFLFGFFWISIWQTKWRIFGIVIMLISLILMSLSPKPDFIIDVNNHVVGIKNKDNKLEIHSDKISKFNRQYWANWFGQQDAIVLPLTEHVFKISDNKIVSLNYHDSECIDANVQINIGNNCMTGELIITQELLKLAGGIIIIFCDSDKCSVKYDDNSRFH